MKYFSYLVILFLLVSSQAMGQEEVIKMRGKITQGLLTEDGTDLLEVKKPKSVSGVKVEVSSEKASQIIELYTKGRSMYSLELEANNLYTITFSKENYLNKVIQVSTHNVSAHFLSKKFELITDITLFMAETTEKLEIYTKEPVAICSFDKKRNTLLWDMKHAQKSFRTFIEIISEEETQKILVSNKSETNSDVNLDSLEIEKELRLIQQMTLGLLKNEHILLARAKFETKKKLGTPIPAEASVE